MLVRVIFKRPWVTWNQSYIVMWNGWNHPSHRWEILKSGNFHDAKCITDCWSWEPINSTSLTVDFLTFGSAGWFYGFIPRFWQSITNVVSPLAQSFFCGCLRPSFEPMISPFLTILAFLSIQAPFPSNLSLLEWCFLHSGSNVVIFP
jgi:hypothetical protein